jgi:hypothetical protein
MSIRPIALYLPQFHPIPENDLWWGKGFTEWTNVTKAKSLFEGHWQPRLPTDLGFYDLRVPETREAQATLAKQYGIEGFCYWHYWFGGKQIIERPFNEMVESGKPDFPFCIAWANQTWQGTWHGLANNQVLIEQSYPGMEDHIAHFYSLLPAFRDKRYMEVNGKKLVFVFEPKNIPNTKQFIDLWQELSKKEGLKGIHIVGMQMNKEEDAKVLGYDAKVHKGIYLDQFKVFLPREKWQRKYLHPRLWPLLKRKKPIPRIISYKEYVEHYPEHVLEKNEYPWIFTDWDNTPRAGTNGWLFDNATPELFGQLCWRAFRATENKPDAEKIVILKSWNEWAEGNCLEPDNKRGLAYLETFKKSLDSYLHNKG